MSKDFDLEIPEEKVMCLITNKRFKEAKEIIKKEKLDLNYQFDITKTTLLLYATFRPNIGIIELLLKKGADPYVLDWRDYTFIDCIGIFCYGNKSINKWIRRSSVQSNLLIKYPKLYFPLKNNKFLTKCIKNKFKHLETGTDLNLL